MQTLTPLPFNSKPIAAATKSIPFSSAPIAPLSIPDIISQHNISTAQATAPFAPKDPNLGETTADAELGAANKIKSSVTDAASELNDLKNDPNAKGNMGESLINTVKAIGAMAKGGLGVASGVLAGIFSPVPGTVNYLGNKIGNSPTVQKISTSGFGDAVAKGEQAVSDWAQKHPTLVDAANILMAVVGEKIGAPGLEDVKSPISEDLNTVKDTVVDTTKKTAKVVADTTNALADKIPGKDIPGKINRRFADAKASSAELKAAPKEVQAAVKTDIPKPTADFVNNMTDAEKTKALDMLEKQKAGVKAPMKPSERPDAVIGQRALEPVKFLEGQKQNSIVAEGEHVKELGNQSIDLSTAKNNLLDKFKTMGVTIGEDGKLDFSKSELSTPASAKDRGLMQTAVDELKNENISAREGHTIRQRLFNETQGKNFTEPFSDRVVDMIHNNKGTSLRSDILHAINDQAGANGEGYAAEATKNAKIQDALQSFYKAFGKDLNGKDINIQNLKAGEVANRISGNASSVVENALQKVEQLAREYGYKSNVSTRNLVYFKTILKNIVGETQANSLAGAVEQGNKAALPDTLDIAEHAVKGNKLGILKSGAKFIKSNTQGEQIRALEGLLKLKGKGSSLDKVLGF